MRFISSSILIRIKPILFIATHLMAWPLAAQNTPETIVAERLVAAESPVGVRPASHSVDEMSLLIICHSGLVMWFDELTGEVRDEPFLDISATGLDLVDFGISSEQGLNDLILDPDFEENGLFYVMYNGSRPDGTGNIINERLICFGTNPEHIEANVNEWFEVLELVQPARGHNGGQLHFGPLDNFLYLSTGDGGGTGTGEPGGGSGGDDHGPIGNGQNLQSLLGKMLRIQVNGLAPYTIPKDNPFVGNAEALDEIWATGFRNPWRWSFDRLTGDKFIGDVGEVDWEEVNFESANSSGGLNFGWRLMEGPMCYEPTADCVPEGITLESPIFAYPHEQGWCSIIGGYRYRGPISTLYGRYVFTDYCGFGEERFWTLTEQADGTWVEAPLNIDVPGGFASWEQGAYEYRFAMSEDNRGDLYLCTLQHVYRMQFDPDDVTTSDPLPDVLVFSPNPAGVGSQITMNLGDQTLIDRLRIIDASGRIVHNASLNFSSAPYSWFTSGMVPGTYIIEAWVAGEDAPRRGRLAIVRQ
jgi:hypothetical protein